MQICVFHFTPLDHYDVTDFNIVFKFKFFYDLMYYLMLVYIVLLSIHVIMSHFANIVVPCLWNYVERKIYDKPKKKPTYDFHIESAV